MRCPEGKKKVCMCRGKRKVNPNSQKSLRLAYQGAQAVAGGKKKLGVKNFKQFLTTNRN